MRLFLCGDIMPGGVLPYQVEYLDQNLKQHLQSFDVRIGTLECAIGTGIPYDKSKMQGNKNIVYARDEDFYRIREMNFNVVSLANNHVFDLGEEGLRNTIKTLKENNIAYVGAGMNISQASRPAVLTVKGKTIAFLAACMYGNKYLGYIELAEGGKAGVNPLNIQQISADIKMAKQQYDYVFVLPHWGKEHDLFPMNECVMMAKEMIDAGADGIFGSHAHVPQPHISYHGKPICFGMGNFLFPDFYLYPPRPIWYPEKEYDFSTIKVRKGYPDFVQEPSKATWGKMERVGEIVTCSVNNSVRASYDLVQMTDNNVLIFHPNPTPIRRKLSFMGFQVKHPLLKIAFQSIKTIINNVRGLLGR